MSTWEMRADFFVEEFEPGGKRDQYYQKSPKFKRAMPLPKCRCGGAEIFVLQIYTEPDGHRVWVKLCDDEDKQMTHASGMMDIDTAVIKASKMPWVAEQLKRPIGAAGYAMPRI